MTVAAAGAPATIREFAPAKINLSLQVVGKRADGYHLLDSLVVFAGVGDELTFAPADRLDLANAGPRGASLPTDSGNLVIRAAEALAAAAGIEPRAAIRLEKRLPVASGIGGGSADAAAALRGLNRLWDLGVEDDELARIGIRLGADLPVCLRGRPVRVSGIGETLEPLPSLPAAWLALVNPGIPLPTRDVFLARQGPFSRSAAIPGWVDLRGFAAALAERGNDLAEAARRLVPSIGDTLAALAASPGCLVAGMSGSGATCFGLFAEATAADTAATRLAALRPDWWCAAAPILA